MGHFESERLTLHVHSRDPLRFTDDRMRVIDGDTIYVGGERWRLIGVDAPELHGGHCAVEDALGARAKEMLEQLIWRGWENGTLRMDVRDLTDKFKRRLVSISIDGRDVGELLKEQNLAKDWNGRGPRPVWCQCPFIEETYHARRVIFEERQARSRHRHT